MTDPQLCRCFTYRNVCLFVFVHVGRKQNPIDLMEDPIRADVVAVRHISLIDEDPALKTSHNQTINTNPPCVQMKDWLSVRCW